MVENHQIGIFGLFDDANFFKLACTHKKLCRGRAPMPRHQCDRLSPRRNNQLLELLGVEILPAVIDSQLN